MFSPSGNRLQPLRALVCLAVLSGSAAAGDWPQILGPQRNGRAEREALLESWPSGGPREIWHREVGHGYAGIAAAGNICILFHRVGDEAVVEQLDAATGERHWKRSFPTHYVSDIAPDDGPRAVPIIDNDQIIVFGADGDLHALSLDTGDVRWTRELYKECDAPSGYFGAGSSPIVEGELIVLNVGGKSGNGLVALDRKSGKTAWHKTDELASYSSPVAATIDGKRQIVFVTRLNVVSVDPLTGEERFRFPFGMRGPTVNAASPVVLGDRLFITASYGVGARLAKLGAAAPQIVWENDESMSSQYTTPIQYKGCLYGIHGRQDVGVAQLRCVDLETGSVRWTEPDFGTANLIAVDDKLLIQKTGGELVLARANPQQFTVLARAKVLPEGSVVQALPALSNGRLYVRNETVLKVFEVGH